MYQLKLEQKDSEQTWEAKENATRNTHYLLSEAITSQR